MKNKKLNTKDLVDKIEKLTKSRIAHQHVVSLDQFRTVKHNLEPKSLLIIEDDEIMRGALQRIFEPEGYVLRLAADATELSKVLDDNPVDLIVIDIGLPWINGFELAELLKENKDLKKIPLIFMSGNYTDSDVKRAFDLGADDFIKKPFDIEKLKKTVQTLLRLHQTL